MEVHGLSNRPFRCMDAGIFFFMGKDPAFLLYSADFLIGVADLDMEERGQYITLLLFQHQKGRLSQKTIRLLVANVSDSVMAKFRQDESGLYYSKRLEEEIEKRRNFTDSRRENGRKGGRPKANAKPNGYPNGMAKNNLSENENINENDNEIVISKKNKSEIKREINSDWPDIKKREYILHHYPSVLRMQKPLTEEQLMRLVEEFGRDAVHKKMEALENKKDAVKKYKSAFLTLRSWCRDFPDISHEAKKQSNKEKIKEAMEILQSGQSLIPEFK